MAKTALAIDQGPASPCLVKPKQARSRRTVERIVTATHAMIKADGYENLSMSALAARAEVGLGSLYNRFPSKERLLIFLAEDVVVGKLRADHHPAVAPSVIEASTLEAFLKTYTRAVAEIFCRHRAILMPMTSLARTSSDHELTDYLVQVNQEIHGELGAILRSHLNLRTNARSKLTIEFALSWLGAALREQYLFDANPPPLCDASIDLFTDELVRAISLYLKSATGAKGTVR